MSVIKYLLSKQPKKKHHHKNEEKGPEKTVPSFVAFGLSAFGLLFFLVPILLGIWALGAFEIKHGDRFYPGVFVGGEPVGGQTYTEALKHFEEKALSLEKEGLNINFESSKGIREINIPMSTMGLTPDNSIEYFTLGDWKDNLQKAYEWGHGVNIFRSLGEQLTLLFTKKNFVFPATIQKEAVKSLLENELYNFFKESVPARFSLAENKIFVSPEEVGENINKEEVLNALEKKLAQFDTTPITFRTYIDNPIVTEAKLEPFLEFTRNFAKERSLVFQYQKREWKIKGSKITTWFTINEENKIGIDRTKLESYLSGTIAKFVDSPPKNSRFEIQNGQIIEIVSGKPGNVIDIEKAAQKIEKMISETDLNLNPQNYITYLPIEIIKVEPKITKKTLEQYQIKDLVGETHTSFEGSSSDREHNIKIGIATINGILIAPGAEFSTVSAIGPVSEKEGYVKELVIKENKTTKEFGGGLCQVATTLFRLALNAGLNITERINHRFVVHYYDPPGLDATIYAPHPDLRFINNTGGYLLLQARVENKQVIMEFYGQKDGRSVEISEPDLYNKIPAPKTKYLKSGELLVGQTKCSETPHDGVTTNVLYTVTYPDGTIEKRDFKSIYQPWQKVCLVGTALKR